MARSIKKGRALRPMGTLVVGAMVGLALFAAACGGGTHASGVASLGKTTPTSGIAGGVATTLPPAATVEAHYRKALRFSECMRSNGVTNFPDPSSGGGIDISSSSGIDPQSAQFQAAQKACHKYLPVPHLSKAQIAQEKAQALEFAKCIRAHGVPNFPDPQFAANGGEIETPSLGFDPNSPSFQAATAKCNG